MKPVSPVFRGFEKFEVQVGQGQKQYITIPTVITNNLDFSGGRRFISRWEFTPAEREHIAAGGSLLFQQLVFGEDGLFNPICLSIERNLNEEVG